MRPQYGLNAQRTERKLHLMTSTTAPMMLVTTDGRWITLSETDSYSVHMMGYSASPTKEYSQVTRCVFLTEHQHLMCFGKPLTAQTRPTGWLGMHMSTI